MANMVGNKYNKMAEQIMQDMALQEREAVGLDNAVSDGHAPYKKAKLGKYLKSPEEEQVEAYDESAEKLGLDPTSGKPLAAQVGAQMLKEGFEEGTDVWYQEQTARIIDQIDPSTFFTELSAEQAFSELGMTIDPEELEIYDAADPETRMGMIDYLIAGNGQASLANFESMANDAATGSAPTEMQPAEEDEIIEMQQQLQKK